jgi:hypothetical protein
MSNNLTTKLFTQIDFWQELSTSGLDAHLIAHCLENMQVLQEAIDQLTVVSKQDKVVKTKYALYQQFVGVYSEWVKKEVGIVDMDARQGKAMNDIIGKLMSSDAITTEEQALVAWKFIIDKWERLNQYLKDRRKLSDINSNFIEILAKIKHGTGTTSKQEAAARDLAERKRAAQGS